VRGLPERQMSMHTITTADSLIPPSSPHPPHPRRGGGGPYRLDSEFEQMYATTGCPSVPPEQLLKATVLMALCSIRS
jgi:hypothetical protein